MRVCGERAPRADAEVLVRRRICASQLRHRYPDRDLRGAFELRPIVRVTAPLHGRHDRSCGIRQRGVFLDGGCVDGDSS